MIKLVTFVCAQGLQLEARFYIAALSDLDIMISRLRCENCIFLAMMPTFLDSICDKKILGMHLGQDSQLCIRLGTFVFLCCFCYCFVFEQDSRNTLLVCHLSQRKLVNCIANCHEFLEILGSFRGSVFHVDGPNTNVVI